MAADAADWDSRLALKKDSWSIIGGGGGALLSAIGCCVVGGRVVGCGGGGDLVGRGFSYFAASSS